MSRASRWKWLTYPVLTSVLLATQFISAPTRAETSGLMDEVTSFTVVRFPGEVAFSWETADPTTSQIYLRWSLPGEAAGEPILLENNEPALHHDLSLPTPDPAATAWGYIVSSGGRAPIAPLSFTVPPYTCTEPEPPASSSTGPPEPAASAPTGSATGVAGGVRPDALPSFVETEPNDTPQQANPISPGRWTGSHGVFPDPDWFSADVPAGKVVRLDFNRAPIEGIDAQHPAVVLVEVYRWNPGSPLTLLYRKNFSPWAGTLDFSLYESIHMLIRIQEQYDNYHGDYTLEFSVNDNPDAAEPDSSSRPRCLLPGGPAVTGFLQDSYDTDYFSLVVPASMGGKILELELDLPVSAVLDYGYGSFRLTGPQCSAGYLSPPSGTYALRLSTGGLPGSLEPYTIRTDATPNPDRNEPNDSYWSATPWPAGTDTVQGYLQWINDQDYFSTYLAQGKTISMSISALYFVGPVTIMWQSGGRSYSRDLRSGPFVAPVAAEPTFAAPILDVTQTASEATSITLDLPSCGDRYVRVRGLDQEGTWTAWSEVRGFRAGLVRLLNPPGTYCASEVGPAGEADFGYEVTMPCDLVFSIVDGANRTVWQTTLSSQAGGYLYTWPGVALRSEGYSVQFNAILAPPGRYTVIVSAACGAPATLTDEARAEFSVVW